MTWENQYVKSLRQLPDGYNCLSLIQEVYRDQLGLEIDSYESYYDDLSDGKGMQEAFDVERDRWRLLSDAVPRSFDRTWEKWRPIIRPLDAVWARWGETRHVMIYTTVPRLVLHWTPVLGVVTEDMGCTTWKNRLLSLHRLAE